MSGSIDYRMRVTDDLGGIPASKWNALVAAARHRDGADAAPPDKDGGTPQPFLRHEFLHAMALTGCTGEAAGWIPRHLLLEDGAGELRAVVPLYLKTHSYGEYVFDWAWADAYQRHGLRYYPKLLSAVPFTPVSGPRLIAADGAARAAAAQAVMAMARDSGLSSLHLLFPPADEAQLLEQAGAMLRCGVQFHWRNRDWASFDAFLADLSQPKRKKIRAERRKVAETGLRIERRHGRDIRERDWAFFSRCYANTYAMHGSTPYLNRAFFERIGDTMADNLVMVIAHDGQRPIATSLLVVDDERVYGRYWGAVAQVPCLHFELCYYQAIDLAIESRRAIIEGGAQGEHKMARGFDAVATSSAHWLAEPAFAEAVDRYLAREGGMISAYLGELDERSPFRPPRADGDDEADGR